MLEGLSISCSIGRLSDISMTLGLALTDGSALLMTLIMVYTEGYIIVANVALHVHVLSKLFGRQPPTAQRQFTKNSPQT
jgi:hypothetical protein